MFATPDSKKGALSPPFADHWLIPVCDAGSVIRQDYRSLSRATNNGYAIATPSAKNRSRWTGRHQRDRGPLIEF